MINVDGSDLALLAFEIGETVDPTLTDDQLRRLAQDE
jgi:hypothetical protein